MAETVGIITGVLQAAELHTLSPIKNLEVKRVAVDFFRNFNIPTGEISQKEFILASAATILSVWLVTLAHQKILAKTPALEENDTPPTKDGNVGSSPKSHPPVKIEGSDEVIVEIQQVSSPSLSEEDLELQVTMINTGVCEDFGTIESHMARAQELKRDDLVSVLQNIIAREQRYQDLKGMLTLGTMNQFHPQIANISVNPCRFCAYLFIEKMLTTNKNPTSQFVDTILQEGSTYKNEANISDSVYFKEDVLNFYEDKTALELIQGAKTVLSFNVQDLFINAPLDNSPINTCTSFLEFWLPKDDLGVMATFHEKTFAIVRKNGLYYLFDSHGSTSAYNREEAFIVPFKELKDLVEILTTYQYPNHASEYEKEIVAFQQDDCAQTFDGIKGSFEKHFDGKSISFDDYNSFFRDTSESDIAELKGNFARDQLKIRFDRNLLEIVPLRKKRGS